MKHLGSGGGPPGKMFILRWPKSQFLKIGIKLLHKNCPKLSTCVEIDELASLDAKKLVIGKTLLRLLMEHTFQ